MICWKLERANAASFRGRFSRSTRPAFIQRPRPWSSVELYELKLQYAELAAISGILVYNIQCLVEVERRGSYWMSVSGTCCANEAAAWICTKLSDGI